MNLPAEIAEETSTSRALTRNGNPSEFLSEVELFLSNTLPDNQIELEPIEVKSVEGLRNSSPAKYGYYNRALLNEVKNLNNFLSECNKILSEGQYFMFTFKTKAIRSKQLFEKYPRPIGYPFFAWDFFVHRVMPKLSLTKNIYFHFTDGRYKSISMSECLARIVCSGFTIEGYNAFDDKNICLVQKTGRPQFSDQITKGLLISLPRIGYNGELIRVYKFRTMHPYSEFLQEYLYENNGTKDGDKIINDFRVTRWGKFFRKYWIDEIPMLINYLKGDLKLVGVRPLSEHKFLTYPVWLQKARIRVKPGLIPPYYADMPETPEEFYEAERAYLEEYSKRPLRTDLKYFRKSLFNILFKGARSK